MKMKKIDIREVEGFKLGSAENIEGGTGVTVIISEEGAVGGVDVRGGAPATRETDLLRSENTVDKINAVFLSGGSAFGLEAGSGIMRELAARQIGYNAGEGIYVPIVPGAALYDLPVGRSDVFPDVGMGRRAVSNAFEGVFESGNHGAGTGASVGKYMGMNRAMKSGVGTFACGDDCVQVGAVAAVNAVGDIYNGAGNIIAGLRSSDGSEIYGTIRVFKGLLHEESSPDLNLSDIKTMAVAEALQRLTNVQHSENPDDSRDESVKTDEMDDIVKAMQQSYEQEQTAAQELSASAEEVHVEEAPAELIKETVKEAADPEAIESTEEASSVEDTYLAMDEAEEAAETIQQQEEPQIVQEHGSSDIEEEQKEPQEEMQEEAPAEDDEFVLTEEDRNDMGYDIPFNTTISCLITNAVLTKTQANKLASILHDAYARAIKPVHGTMDGDTIFVMSTCTQEVNFDAFAALAVDVMQYAIIDAASSSEAAYGLPAARDIIRK